MNDEHTSSGPLTATHWGTYRARMQEGRLVALQGIASDPEPSPIAGNMLDTVADRCRIASPMVRAGWLAQGPGGDRTRRGAEAFVAVSWERVEGLLAAELARVKGTHGNRAIYAGSYGWASAGRFHHAQSQLYRFLNCMGGYTARRDSYSYAAGEVILPHVIGDLVRLLAETTSWPSIIEHADLVVAFGGLPLKNAQVNPGGIGQHNQQLYMRRARERGVAFVNLSPVRGDVDAALQAEWLAPRPGTDVAVMLGLAHTLYSEGLHDREFLARYCTGFERFLPYLTGETDGQPKDVDWAAAISGLDAGVLRALARRMAAGRTMISLAWSLTRQDHGEQPWWMGVTLAAMLGHIGLPGGGVGFGYAATGSVGNHTGRLPWAALPQGRNPVADFIPVARITDMLLNPGGTFRYNGGTYEYPDIRLVWWAGGNVFHHHQDLNRLLRAWQRVETVVVNEAWWNPMARHADVVLPVSTALERDDYAASSRDGALVAMSKVLEPYAKARSDHAIFRALARRMGFEQVFTEGRDEGEWLRHLYDVTRQRAAAHGAEMPSYERFRAEGVYVAPAPEEPVVMLRAFREDPVANPLPTPSGRIEIYSERIASFALDDCRGHPAWFEPAEWLGGAGAQRHPLHLISSQPATRLHSQLDNGAVSRAAKPGGREPLTLHPEDAAARGILTGDVVRVFNARGACLASARVSDEVRRGVVQMATGAWYDPDEPGVIGATCKHGNPNVLTLDRGTSSLAQGPVAESCLVEVASLAGEAPPVTAFVPPVVVEEDGAGGA